MKRIITLMLVVAVLLSMFMVNVLAEDNKIILKIGDNIPDRKSPMGLVLEEINAKFLAKHPNVEIQTESYQDQPYQQKIKIYAASNQLPDIFKYWSFSTLLGPLAQNGYILELDKKDFEKLNFVPGSLETNMYNGKLYGLPFSMDFWVIYYNKAIFKKYGIKVPTTLTELKNAAKKLRKNNIIPVVTDGKDAWPLCITYDVLAWRTSGDFQVSRDALERKGKFTDKVFVTAAQKFQDLVKAKVFADDLVTTDYGAARNLFGQEKAAMYIMGSWEMGLSTDTAFSENFRKNVSAMKFPADGKGSVDDLFAWYGGNYVISAKTKYKELCLEYLKDFFTLFPQLVWKNKAAMPAQKIQSLPSDNELSKTLVAIAASAKRTSGTPILDSSTAEFKEYCQKYTQELVAGIKTPQQFTKALDEAAQKAAGK